MNRDGLVHLIRIGWTGRKADEAPYCGAETNEAMMNRTAITTIVTCPACRDEADAARERRKAGRQSY